MANPDGEKKVMLEYAADEGARWRRIRRIGTGNLLLIALIVGAWKGPAAWREMQYRYYLRQAMDYSAPADRVVYSDDPADIQKLLPSDPNYHKLDPDAALKNGGLAFVSYRINTLMQLWRVSSYQLGGDAVFLGWRRAPGGERCLVSIAALGNGRARPQAGDRLDELDLLYCDVITPSGLVDDLALVSNILPPTGVDEDRPIYLRMLAGQPDPADESHFSIPYRFGDVSGVIDGYLQRDGTVKLQARWR